MAVPSVHFCPVVLKSLKLSCNYRFCVAIPFKKKKKKRQRKLISFLLIVLWDVAIKVLSSDLCSLMYGSFDVSES